MRLAAEEAIAVAAVLGRVHGQDGLAAAALLDPDHGVGGQPIVGVDEVEAADVVLDGEEVVDERPAHVVDFVHEIGVTAESAAVVVDAVDAVVVALPMAEARENMDFMPAAMQGGGQLGDVNAHAADRDGMQRFPGKQRISSRFISMLASHPCNGRLSKPQTMASPMAARW